MSSSDMVDAMQMDDNARFGMFKLDQFEREGGSSDPLAWEAEASYGADFDKIWLRSEGEHSDGRLDARTEVLWDHAFSSYWDWQLGGRHDAGLGQGRDWAAFGVQGIAPYWFEIEATAYVGDQGRSAARLRAEYELLLTQKLVLQPEFEMNLYGKRDPARELGSGLTDASFGLRLRYEIRREFAPYVGIAWTNRFGATADYSRSAGRDARDAQLVLGLRVWF